MGKNQEIFHWTFLHKHHIVKNEKDHKNIYVSISTMFKDYPQGFNALIKFLEDCIVHIMNDLPSLLEKDIETRLRAKTELQYLNNLRDFFLHYAHPKKINFT